MILAASDLTPRSYPAIRRALELAAHTGDEVAVLHALTLPPLMRHLIQEQVAVGRVPGDFETLASRRLGTARYTAATRRLRDFINRLETGSRRLEASIDAGNPVNVAESRAAAGAIDLVVIGSRGGADTARWGLGSVAEGIVHRVVCDVFVVPAD